MIGVKEPIVHPFNKDEIVDQIEEIKSKIADRENIILLGDGLSDLQMSKNMPVKNIIKIGYLNEKEEELKEMFLENFDVVILNDQWLDKVNEILTNVTS
jgi:5'-nucleotidase